jgi:hemerythrin
MTDFRWNAEYELGDMDMDGAHREFVEVLQALLSAGDEEFPPLLERFRQHAESHFGDEDRLMQDEGYASAECHLDEHKAVLGSVVEVQQLVAHGNIEVGRRLARELARWFPEHTVAMDKGLAAWAQKKRLVGVKITISRSAPKA